jgi:spectinomycin phosphotransferase
VTEEEIRAALEREYGLRALEVTPLALGADPNSAVYRARTRDADWFVKLRRGAWSEAIARLPGFLRDAGIGSVLAPVPTKAGRPWAELAERRLFLFPFIEARRALEVTLSESQWRELGKTLRQLHSIVLPESLVRGIPCETWSPVWRERVRRLVADPVGDASDSIARRGAALLRERRAEILDLVDRAERLAAETQARAPVLALCHTDIHGGNVLVDERGDLFIIDWDAPIFAPKERDLMFFGGGQGWVGVTPDEEQRLFRGGYGEAPIERSALAYYRCERIIQDIAPYADDVLHERGESRTGREESLRRLAANFIPGGTIERARAT